jgi:RNA polymerase sigma-70 factor (ECF subfamily)
MAAAHGGDKRRYEQLLRELGAVIEQYVRRRFGRLAFIDDCVQECLLAIHLARHTYDPRRPFRPWFFTIVRNKTIDLLRRAYYAPARADEGAAWGAESDAGAGDPAGSVVAGELLTRLEPSHRDALMLTKIVGYSLAEAAAQLGISEAAMKSRVNRAIRATALLLQREQEQDLE